MFALGFLLACEHDEELKRQERRKISRRSLENVAKMSASSFLERFALDKDTFEALCSDLRAHTSLRGTPHIPLEIKVLCTLSFLASGSKQGIEGITQYLTQQAASRCIRQVIEALNSEYMTNKWMKSIQNEQERSRISEEFQRKFNLPGVVGCIEGFEIAIMKPNEDDSLYYHEFTKRHVLKLELICDSNFKIRDLNINEGSKENDGVWSSCEMYLRGLHQNGEKVWLLGDFGYKLREWLMTPLTTSKLDSQQKLYNERNYKARYCSRVCCSLLRIRWKCLRNNEPLKYSPFVATRIIQACCILHNIAVDAKVPTTSSLLDDDYDEEFNNLDWGLDDETRAEAMLKELISKM